MIYTITLNPALDKTVVVPSFTVDQVNRITQMRLDPGGKGINVSKVIENLGGTSHAYAALGGAAGQRWRQLAEHSSFSLHVIPAEGETRTNVKIVDPVFHSNTDVNEPGPAVSETALEMLMKDLRNRLQREDILVLSGSVPAGVDKDIYGRLAAMCRECGARAMVDAEGLLLTEALKAAPYLVKPNHYELAGYVGRELHTVEEMAEAAQQMLDDGAQMVLVSMGADGALLCWREEDPVAGHGTPCAIVEKDRSAAEKRCHILQAVTPQVSVVSTVGAGDSMVGAFAWGLDQGMSLEEAFGWSVAAGTAAVTCDGSLAPAREQIEAILKKVEQMRLI